MKLLWDLMREEDCNDTFEANGTSNFFPRSCCPDHNKFDQRTPGLFKEEFRCSEMTALCSKSYCCYNVLTNVYKLACKSINKDVLIQQDPMDKFRRVLFGREVIQTENRGFRVVNNQKVCTYELKKTGLSYFYPKRKVLGDGIHTVPLDI